MTRNSDLWLSIERYLDSSRNWNLYRRHDASLNKRIEGFTERWGDSGPPSSSDSIADCWRVEQEAVATICSTQHPQTPLRIYQYRPAWLEQLVLRIANLPHVVINSCYAVSEMTGPLPYIQDFEVDPPAMTGRLHPSVTSSSFHQKPAGNSSILDYLKLYRNLDLDESLSPEQMSQSRLYKTMIQETLAPALAIVRYQDDAAWEQINRPRCVEAAAATGDGDGSRSSRMLAWMQARSERKYQQSQLSPAQRALSTEAAIQHAREAYQSLETVILIASAQQQKDKTKGKQQYWLLGTTMPTLVDALLWDHLMDALTDIHLVVVLADFPVLIEFVQSVWETYFVTEDNNITAKDWQVWNAEQNEMNAFSQVPSLVNRPAKDDADDDEVLNFRHAVDLMEHLSVRDRNLGESLTVAKEARALQRRQQKNHHNHAARRRRPFETWHRWRLGGELFPAQPDDTNTNAERPDVAGEQEKKIRREYKQNDETWMATVALGTTAMVLLFGLGGQKEG